MRFDLKTLKERIIRKWKKNWETIIEKNLISFRSNPTGLLWTIFGALVFSLINGFIFGVGWDDQFDVGTWFVLGGFTMWVPTSGMILPAIIGTLIHSLTVQSRITIEGNEKEIEVKEPNFGIFRGHYVIKRGNIDLIRIIRRPLGLKSIWITLFGAHMAYMLTTGLSLLFNPNNFGYGIGNGLLFTIAGLFDLAFIIIYIISHHTIIQIHANGSIYRIPYYHKDRKGQEFNQYDRLEKILGIGLPPDNAQMNSITDIPLLQSGAGEILMGGLLIMFAVLSFIFKIFAGILLRYFLILLGIWLISLGILHTKHKNSEKGSIISFESPITHEYLYKSDLFLQKETIWVKNLESLDSKIIQRPIHLTPLAITLTSLATVLIGWTLAIWFRFLPYGDIQQSLIWKSIFNLILSIFTLVIFFLIFIQMGNVFLIEGNTGQIKNSLYPLEVQKLDKTLRQKKNLAMITILFTLLALGVLLGILL